MEAIRGEVVSRSGEALFDSESTFDSSAMTRGTGL